MSDPYYRKQLEKELRLLCVVRRIFAAFLSLQAICAFWFFAYGLGTVPSVLWVPVMWFAVSSLILGPVLLFFAVLFSIGIRDRRRQLEEA